MKSRDATLQEIRQTFGQVPRFLEQTPEPQLQLDTERYFKFYFADTALWAKDKCLIGLATSAAIQSPYSIYFNTESARRFGCNDQEIYDSILVARHTKYWSAWLHGKRWPLDSLINDTNAIVNHVRYMTPNGQQQRPRRSEHPTRMEILQEIRETLGFVPQWFEALPDPLLAIDWQEFADWQLGQSPLRNQLKELCGLAVAAAIHCPYCTYFHTEAAKLNGANPAQIDEAIAVARLVVMGDTELMATNYPFDQFKAETGQMLSRVEVKGVARVA